MYSNFFKRLIDLTISLIALIILSPVLLVVTVWLHLANKGAGAFFSQERPGLNEKIFKLYKFKSMNDVKDDSGKLLPDAERITPIGKFIRKTSLDELPQLWNVLKGDMSLIGPRPLLVRYLPYYTDEEKRRHTVRPGITGLSQVSGRNNLNWDDRLKTDVKYVDNISFLLDCKIVLLTIKKVIKREDIVVVLDPTINVPLDVYRNEKR